MGPIKAQPARASPGSCGEHGGRRRVPPQALSAGNVRIHQPLATGTCLSTTTRRWGPLRDWVLSQGTTCSGPSSALMSYQVSLKARGRAVGCRMRELRGDAARATSTSGRLSSSGCARLPQTRCDHGVSGERQPCWGCWSFFFPRCRDVHRASSCRLLSYFPLLLSRALVFYDALTFL